MSTDSLLISVIDSKPPRKCKPFPLRHQARIGLVQGGSLIVDLSQLFLYAIYAHLEVKHQHTHTATWWEEFYIIFNSIVGTLVILGCCSVLTSFILSFHCCWLMDEKTKIWLLRCRGLNIVIAALNLLAASVQLIIDSVVDKVEVTNSSVDWTDMDSDFAIFIFSLIAVLNSFLLFDDAYELCH